MPDSSSKDRETAIHEAGHAVIAYVCSHEIAEMRISDQDDPKTEGVSVIKMNIHDAKSAEMFVSILLGGIIAIAIDTGVVQTEVEHFNSDFRHIDEIRKKYPAIDEHIEELIVRVTVTIEKFYRSGTIENLVQELIQHRRLGPQRIYEILQQ
jgi:hypothetical protein